MKHKVNNVCLAWWDKGTERAGVFNSITGHLTPTSNCCPLHSGLCDDHSRSFSATFLKCSLLLAAETIANRSNTSKLPPKPNTHLLSCSSDHKRPRPLPNNVRLQVMSVMIGSSLSVTLLSPSSTTLTPTVRVGGTGKDHFLEHTATCLT